MALDEYVVDKEMGTTHKEFFRLLPKAFAAAKIDVDGLDVRVSEGGQQLRIELSGETERRLGNFRLPVIHARLTFSGYSEDEREAALERFWRAFQKGGG